MSNSGMQFMQKKHLEKNKTWILSYEYPIQNVYFSDKTQNTWIQTSLDHNTPME